MKRNPHHGRGEAVLALGLAGVAGSWVLMFVFWVLLLFGVVGCSSPPSFVATVTDPKTGKEKYTITGTWDDGQSAIVKASGPVGQIIGGIIQTIFVAP